MADVVELNRKSDKFTVDEILGIAQREGFEDVLIIGFDKDFIP